MSGVDNMQTTLPSVTASQEAMEPYVPTTRGKITRYAPESERLTFLQMLGIEPSPPPRKEHRKPWH